MKPLKISEMASLSGGGFFDGVCSVVALGRLFAAPLAITGVGLGVLTGATAACIIAKAYKLY